MKSFSESLHAFPLQDQILSLSHIYNRFWNVLKLT